MLSVTHAASFECTAARTEVEKMICADDVLSKLDDELSKGYQQSLQRHDIRQKTVLSQRQWLKNMRNPCQDVDCIKKAYETRIKEIGLTSSFGIVMMRPTVSASPPLQPIDRPDPSAVPIPQPKSAIAETSISNPPIAFVTNCDKSVFKDALKLPSAKSVSQLIEMSRESIDKRRFECSIQALEQANLVIQSVGDSSERAALSFEIKDIVYELIRYRNLTESAIEQRAVLSAVPSLDRNDDLVMSAGEDERYNDAVFLGRLVETGFNDNQTIFRIYKLNSSLPAGRHAIGPWHHRQYTEKLAISEIANLWEASPEDVRIEMESALIGRLGSPLQSYVLTGITLIPRDKAKQELAGLIKLQPAIEKLKEKQGPLWIWWVYRYMAEAYWQSGDQDNARKLLGMARQSILTANAIPGARVGAFMYLTSSMCKLIRENGKGIQKCPIGIYTPQEMAAMIDELEEMAKATSDSYALSRVGVLRKQVPLEIAK